MTDTTKYDPVAKHIYYTLGEGRGWTAFERITRKERDYWRARAQVALETQDWPYQIGFAK